MTTGNKVWRNRKERKDFVRAIIAGERNPRKLTELSHPRIEASREEIAKSLAGNWPTELVFVLRQVEMHDTYQRRIAESAPQEFALRPGNHDIELRDHDRRTFFQERVAVMVGQTTKLCAQLRLLGSRMTH